MIKSVSWSKQPSLTALAAGTLIATGYLFSGSATAADAADGPPKGAIFDDTKIQQLDDRDAARQRSRSRSAPSHQPWGLGAPPPKPPTSQPTLPHICEILISFLLHLAGEKLAEFWMTSQQPGWLSCGDQALTIEPLRRL